MSEISSGPSLGAQLYAMKKATDVQSQAVLKVLESVDAQNAQLHSSKAADITGIGKNLDIKG